MVGQIGWSVCTPGTAHNSIEPDGYFNRPVQLDLASPPGDMTIFTSPAGTFAPVLKDRLDHVGYDSIEMANGGPFLTLPPLYGLAVIILLSATAQISLTVWYQSITDHIPPPT